MVITNSGLEQAKEFALDYFDNFLYMAIGDSNTSESPTLSSLGNELVRDPSDIIVKDLGNDTYDFECSFELSDGAGSTIREAGIFDASSSGNMGFRKVLPIEVNKTSSFELVIKLRVTITAENG